MSKLAIILCTYNGGEFLEEQLKSFNEQKYKDWHLFIYDDCSTDNTRDIAEKTIPADKLTFVSNQKNLGFATNFLNAIKVTPDNFDFYAISDQDDVWLEGKLERATSYLRDVKLTTPTLYCSRTTLVDATKSFIGHSPLFNRKPSFNNALVQSIAGGNTMVLNQAARSLVVEANQINVISHDWFIYQLISGAGGKVKYDIKSEILYRQHGRNIIGANTSLIAKVSRIKMLLNNSFRSWNDVNIEALKSSYKLLTKENQIVLDKFIEARKSFLPKRVWGFLRCGLYRQTLAGNIALYIGAILNKI